MIDFHTHFLPQVFPPLPDGADGAAWPRMAAAANGAATLFVGARKVQDFADIYWNVSRRLTAMDAAGIAMQFISPLPELLSYALEPAAARVLADAVNADCARMVAQAPDRLRGLATVVLQDVGSAVQQLEALASVPGIAGIFVGSNVNGVSIASAQFDPVFAAAEKFKLLVFVHGYKPGGLERMEGPPLMAAVIGVPHEITMAVASFMMTDVLGKFPALQLVFSHGGGGLGAVMDRMTLIWNKFPAMRDALKMPPPDYASRFWFDTVVFGADYLKYLGTQFGAGRLLAGTDGPTDIGQTNLPGFLASAGFDAADIQRIGADNAIKLLALTAAPVRQPG